MTGYKSKQKAAQDKLDDDDIQMYQRPWVALKPEEILDLFDVNNVYGSKWVAFARAVEAKLKERNA